MRLTRLTKENPRRLSRRVLSISLSAALAVNSLLAGMPVFNTQVASAATTVTISNVAELRSAIENQAPNQVWNIAAGNYGLSAFNDITVEGQTGWYFPITEDNITINGAGEGVTTLYGTGYTTNGSWHTQNFVSIFGDNVTLNGLTLMPKVEPNKTIEVLGGDVTIKNVTIEPNTLTNQLEYDSIPDSTWAQEAKQWGGSLYFNHAGDHLVENVTIKNAGISYRYAPSGTNITLNNVTLDYTSNADSVNSYRYSSGFNNSGNSVAGTPRVVYHVSSTLNNLMSVFSNIHDEDTVVLDEDITIPSQITIGKKIVFDGQGHTASVSGTGHRILITADGTSISNIQIDKTDKTGTQNIIGIQADDVTIDNIHVTGHYEIGDSEVVRALEVSSVNDLTVSNSTFTHLRQPAYVNTATGSFSNNFVSDTKGWVLISPSNIHFSGNSWGTNDTDIAIIDTDNNPSNNDILVNNYPCSVMAQIKADNNNANIDNKVLSSPCDFNAPTTPQINKPTTRQWFKSTPIVNAWTASTDDSGSVDHYQVAYRYDNGHTFGGSTCAIGEVVDGQVVSGCRDTSSTSRNHNPNNNEEGGVTVWVRAFDAAGNASPWSDSVHYYFDHTAPTTDIVAPSGVVGNSFTVSGDAHDNLSLNRVYVQLVNRENNQRYGGTTISLIANGINPAGVDAHWSKTFDANALALPDGEYAAHVSVVDMAGNTSSAGWTADFTVDSTAPNVSGIVLNGQNVSNSDVRNENCTVPSKFHLVNGVIDLDATITDELSNVASATYKIRKVSAGGCTQTAIYQSSTASMANVGGNDWETVTGSRIDTTSSEGLVDGNYTIQMTIKDSLGNQVTKYVDITVDNTAPVVEITAPADGSMVNHAVDIRGTVTDANPHHYWLQVKHNGTVILSQTVNRTTNMSDELLKTVSDEGEYEVTLAARDAIGGTSSSGNRSDNKTLTFKIDRLDPAVSIENVTISTDKELSFDLSVIENGLAGLEIISANIYDATNTVKLIELGAGNPSRLNMPYAGLAAGTFSFDLALSGIDVSGLNTGTYTIRAYARDNAGNEHRFLLVQFNIDNTNPVISGAALSDDNFSNTAGNPSITGTVNGNGSDVDYVQYRIYNSDETQVDGFGWVNLAAADAAFDSELEDFSGEMVAAGLVEGDYFARVRAFDVAGNKKSGIDLPFTIDNTAPVLTLVNVEDGTDTFRTISGTGEPGTSVHVEVHSTPQTWDGTVANDGTWSHTFSNLGLGTHSVMVTLADAAGNTAEAEDSFRVVNPKSVNNQSGGNVLGIQDNKSTPTPTPTTVAGAVLAAVTELPGTGAATSAFAFIGALATMAGTSLTLRRRRNSY